MLTTFLNPTIWLLLLIAGGAVVALVSRRRPAKAKEDLLRLLTSVVVVGGVGAAALAGVAARVILGYQAPGTYAEEVIAARSYLSGRDLYADQPRATLQSWLPPGPAPAETWRLPGITPCQAGAMAQRGRFYVSQAHPPFLLILAIPVVAVAGPRGYYVVLSALSLASVWLIARALGRRGSLDGRPRLALVLGLALVAWQPVLASLRGGSVSVIVAALLVLAWLLVKDERLALGGATVGLAASVHPLALPLAAWLPRLSWRAFWTAMATLGVTAATTLAVAGGGALHEFWAGALETARTYSSAPQNYALLTKGAALGADGWAGPIGATAAFMLVFIAAALSIAGARERMSPTIDSEYALLVVTGLLIAPVTWSSDLAVLVVPLAVLFARSWVAPSPGPLIGWAVLALGVSLPDGPVMHLWSLLVPVTGTGTAGVFAAVPAWALLGLGIWLIRTRAA